MTATVPDLPQYIPTSRSLGLGNFPVKTYRSQNGAEMRLLYGDKRTNMTMQLSYQNVADSVAQEFVEHFIVTEGTFKCFAIGTASRDGWSQADKYMGASEWGNEWRYSKPPQLTSVYPGVSSVTVELVAVINTP